ncbi:cellulose synthase complex periplasmic endoglucanase BcsZ [Burkholderia sp. RF2-non_BP3]|uniref:cellulose synthase complex periplasmic endoglucanase BcsZ n=1 Tax=Burkholderia sp. RF2-non_BP3 TaxID=1637844 RepID=UPI00075D94F0|nr:cellulose synthase complex periplasmic endoglucanase BcsZ [Burkholderia sp. RF2-non_BP3]KUY56109.1 endoglucanase [Burkholderia sp. RF2-non_BP3]
MAWAFARRRAAQPARRVGTTLVLAVAAVCAAPGAAGRAQAAQGGAADVRCGAAWPRWDAFKRDFVSADGRVIDVGSTDSRTVSEGQAYGLFFALVANDRRTFDTILAWTENNLAQGDLSARLPAWLWGRAPDGAWRVLDANAASDADLWIAYTLVEAGRLWHERSYTARGALLAKRVLDDETASVPGLGLTLLPGPTGFRLADGRWRVNPSYSPPQVIRGLAARLPDDRRWAALAASTGRVLLDTAPKGFAPDWALYRAGAGFAPDPQTHAESAYNAIRVYLWAGMLDRADPLAAPLLARFAPFADYIAAHGAPPEKVDTTTGVAGPNDGNGGFSAAAVPFLDARGQHALADAQAARVDALARQSAPGYYTSVLTLFGLGWREGRYRFGADGSLDARWEGRSCVAR